MSKKKYSITPEHRIELEKIKQKYIANAYRTDAMTEHDKDMMRVAIRGLYANAKIPYCGDDKVIFVSSPLVGQYAVGIATALLNRTKAGFDSGKGHAAAVVADATSAAATATRAAVATSATSAAARAVDAVATSAAATAAAVDAVDATRAAATAAAVDAVDATRAAVDAVVDADVATSAAATAAAVDAVDATRAAVDAAVDAAYEAVNSTFSAEVAAGALSNSTELNKKDSIDIYNAAMIAVTSLFGREALDAVAKTYNYRSRNYAWPYYQVLGEFFKDVAKIEGDWEKWIPLNLDALHGGAKFMTPKFTIICDRPEILKTDDGRLHCENGPAVKWRCGMEMYYWRGVRVPDHWIKDKSSIPIEAALTHENIEQRRCAAEIMGWHNVLAHPSLNLTVINEDADPQIGKLVEVNLPDIGRERFLVVVCGTGRTFALPVPPNMKTALKANAWTYDIPVHLFKPEFRT